MLPANNLDWLGQVVGFNATVFACPCRLVTLASGQAAGRFLRYEDDAPTVAAQTAYGIEAEVRTESSSEGRCCCCIVALCVGCLCGAHLWTDAPAVATHDIEAPVR